MYFKMRGGKRSTISDMMRHMDILGIKLPEKAVQETTKPQVVLDSERASDPGEHETSISDGVPIGSASRIPQDSCKRSRVKEDFASSEVPKLDAAVSQSNELSGAARITLDEKPPGDGWEDYLWNILHKRKIKKLTLTLELEDDEIISLTAEL